MKVTQRFVRCKFHCPGCSGRRYVCHEYEPELCLWVQWALVLAILGAAAGFVWFCEIAREHDPAGTREYEERLLKQTGPWPGEVNEFTGEVEK